MCRLPLSVDLPDIRVAMNIWNTLTDGRTKWLIGTAEAGLPDNLKKLTYMCRLPLSADLPGIRVAVRI